ncbi:MAG: hypothetical protein NC311_14800 [Muribaculaceae bacterium]|nr:hypothetical protein [Muribaculaceae bacterium]
MKEIRYGGNLFLLGPENKSARAAYAVTTNGMLKSGSRLVMGAGIAKYARDNFKGIDTALGKLVGASGNHAYFLGAWEDANRSRAGLDPRVFVISFPTKNDWRDPSSLALITQSAHEAMSVADRNNLDAVYMPMPGCSLGRLDYARDVRPAISGILDGRFHVAVPPEIYDRLP